MSNSYILIIDDEEIVRELIYDTLEDAGYDLISAENGQEGLELFKKHQPILVILDLKMPVMDGVEFLSSVKLTPSSQFSVIVLTGHGDDEEIKTCFRLGVYAFQRKPFNVYEFKGLVRHSISLKIIQINFEECVKDRTAKLEAANKQLESEVSVRKEAEENVKRKYNIQKVISSILSMSLKSVSVDEQMESTLNLLFSIPWLNIQKRGCICIIEGADPLTFDIKAQMGFSKDELEGCKKRIFKECLNTANLTKDGPLQGKHNYPYKIRCAGGFCSVPILFGEQVLGLINLSIDEAEECNIDEDDFLVMVANTLAGIIIRKRMEEQLEKTAHYDMLTDLPNRILFLDRLRQTFTWAKRYNMKFALLFIDINRFKQVNDTFGHHIGDMLLKEIGNRLSNNLRQADTIARMGGDEFTAIITNVTDTHQITHALQRIIKSIDSPFLLDGNLCSVGSSIGISLYPSNGDNPDELIKKADMAMYYAKRSGESAYRFYSIDMDEEDL